MDTRDFRTKYELGANYAIVTNSKTDEVTVVNKRLPYLKIIKRDADTSVTKPLNARFKLEKLAADGHSLDTKFYGQGWAMFWTAHPTYKNDGFLSNRDITDGKYRLTEVEAPDGYRKLTDPIEFEINGKTGELKNKTSLGDSASLSYNENIHTFELTVLNRQTVEIPGSFPLTGGSGFGTHLFITGIFLAASVLWLRHTVQGQVG
ncbi:MSCRAMM family protein [Arcanobacterium hippocoleae]|uniref:MSCRAMM family protein n=1 Tax=Arcanobacterium hippocoleae TaxID=149017 RepID=UPI00333EF1FC